MSVPGDVSTALNMTYWKQRTTVYNWSSRIQSTKPTKQALPALNMTCWKPIVAIVSQQKPSTQTTKQFLQLKTVNQYFIRTCETGLPALNMTFGKPMWRYLVSKNIKETHLSVALSNTANYHKFCILTCKSRPRRFDRLNMTYWKYRMAILDLLGET